MAFEPFLAYELLDEKMAGKLHKQMKDYREALDTFVEDEEPDIEKARVLMQAMEEMEDVYKDVTNDIYRIPAIVHIAGERSEEENPDNPEETATVQRCSRCGSMLQFWYDGLMYLSRNYEIRPLEEEDSRWWDVGQQIAKHDTPGATDLYPIKDRELERWETECADLSGLENILDV